MADCGQASLNLELFVRQYQPQMKEATSRLLSALASAGGSIVLLPVALWVFGSTDSQLVAWGFLVWAVLVSVSDMVLKPMLLGRGVNVPMPVILLGAIGGMVYSGLIGLFLGAVILALSYQLFTSWLELDGSSAAEPPATG